MNSKTKRILKSLADKGYIVRNDGKVFTPDGRERKLRIKSQEVPYYTFNMKFEGEAFPVPVHKFAAYLKFGDKIFEDSIQVRHLDGDSLNNSWENLAIGSPSENMHDRPAEVRKAHALHAATKLRKLTEDEVRQLRQDRRDGLSYRELMTKYGLAKSTVSYIVNRKTYGVVA